MMFRRYAIYHTPRGALADAGAAWLGWDMVRGHMLLHPDIAGLDVKAITQAPRKYGLHGTIKAPFTLAQGTSVEGLEMALAALCLTLKPAEMPGLELAALGSFLALTPLGDQSALVRLAGDVVTKLDMFRAPLDEVELNRRRATHLSADQDKNLRKWGYPYVLDQFRFHITLTGRLQKSQRMGVFAALAPYIEPHLPKPFCVDALTLVGEDDDGKFHQIKRFALKG